jgi:hypothetical protein
MGLSSLPASVLQVITKAQCIEAKQELVKVFLKFSRIQYSIQVTDMGQRFWRYSMVKGENMMLPRPADQTVKLHWTSHE